MRLLKRLFGLHEPGPDQATRPTAPWTELLDLRDEMTQNDPDMARVRRIHHEALNLLTAEQLRHGLQQRKGQHPDG